MQLGNWTNHSSVGPNGNETLVNTRALCGLYSSRHCQNKVMSSDEHAGPARPSVGQKSWKKVNEERKLLKKTYKKENILKRLEKAKKLEELSKEVNQESNEQLRKTSTVSIAVPGSILENAQSAELRTYLAGQIARAACIFQVDEVVVFDDLGVRDFKDNKVKTVGEL